ncbi:hypothetical protein PVAND_011907 [Polypedilum vanderplanki]|uniref:Lipase domain-containing protein n=1 Tax=Polypedilum vanderplanki TaxID=319348 RepID=A0A9J6CK09_POLVA|nr:hypothetical protein PVAND_011907 [Polypedilum vanderplanki]
MFEFFYGTAHNPIMEIYTVDNFASIVNHQAFRNTGRSVIFHFGEGETARDQLIAELITSYLYNGNYNVIVIDYHDLTLITDAKSEELAEALSRGILPILSQYDADNFHFVGNGVGANIISQTAELISNEGGVVSRITGLNPTRLSRFAYFTDTIHTEETFTSTETMGVASYFVNGGVHSQPGCGNQMMCSREFALRVFSESVRSRTPIFPSLQCNSYENYLSGSCNDNQIANMGLLTQTNIFGRFYLQTNTRDPWTRQDPFPNPN